jgi:hypothetical protein
MRVDEQRNIRPNFHPSSILRQTSFPFQKLEENFRVGFVGFPMYLPFDEMKENEIKGVK